MPKSNLNAETFVPVLKSELSRQFNEQFGNTNQYDIKNIDFQNNTAEVVAKDFATDYEPGSTTKIKWNIDELISLPTSITLPTQYTNDIKKLYNSHQYSEQDVFKILAKTANTLNFSELTIDDFDAHGGVITLSAKPTSTVYKTGVSLPIYVNLSTSVYLEYTTTNMVRNTTYNVSKFIYHTTDVKTSSNTTYTIVGGTKTINNDLNNLQPVESTETISFNPKNGQIRYNSKDTNFSGGIFTIKASYTVDETEYEGETKTVTYYSYWTFYAPAYTVPYVPESFQTTVYIRNANVKTSRNNSEEVSQIYLHNTGSYGIPANYWVTFQLNYRAYANKDFGTNTDAYFEDYGTSGFTMKYARASWVEPYDVTITIVLRKNGTKSSTNTSLYLGRLYGDHIHYSGQKNDVAIATITRYSAF